MTIRFDGRVAIVTGAGAGLGRSHALALAARGAKVVVNDLGTDRAGTGSSSAAALAVVAEIEAAGGEAMASGADVADADQVEAMVAETIERWGRIDIVICNAGILRDKSFGKMTLDEFRLVLDVHVMGAVHCCKAVWEPMRAQGYGRILLTSSGSGLYGGFGQANYGTAKAGLAGLMNVLHLEGAKYNVRINAIAPAAATRMTEGLFPPEDLDVLDVSDVTTAALWLVSDDAPSRTIVAAGAGSYALTRIVETEGIYLTANERTPEKLAERLAALSDMGDAHAFASAQEQTERYVKRAKTERG